MYDQATTEYIVNMASFLLERTTKLNTTIDKAWQFFSNPRNLEKITPASMQFKVKTTDLPEEIYSGMFIAYKVSPLVGIPVNWVTKITDVSKPFYFADEQESGPYTYWRHEHLFTENGIYTIMKDKVNYTMPFGIIGSAVHSLLVKNRLKQIFDYRTKIITENFPGSIAL